jgi:hypothetical protein
VEENPSESVLVLDVIVDASIVPLVDGQLLLASAFLLEDRYFRKNPNPIPPNTRVNIPLINRTTEDPSSMSASRE